MNDDIAVKVDHVSKTFRLPHDKQSSIKGLLISKVRGGKRTFEKQEVLKDISFDVKKGEFFGIVGRNGSGKSTLLKMLAGIYSSKEGTIDIAGKLTPFIELGVGFNPELSGRENVFLNGALLGFNRKEMSAMYDDIVAFAELERFMDQKLKNYSSGMQVRLAFSIAIRARSDILLLDEVLAVGDEAFQQKCINVFERYKANKQTVVLVTHDMESVKRFCSRAMLINDGRIIEIGSPRTVADRYSGLNQEEIDRQLQSEIAKPLAAPVAVTEPKQPKTKYLAATILDSDLKPRASFDVGEAMIVNLNWSGLDSDKFESIGVNIFKQSGEHVTGINSRTGEHPKDWKAKGEIGLDFTLILSPGRYNLLVEMFEKEGRKIDTLYELPEFNVRNTKMRWSGLTELPHTWHERQ